MISIAIIDLVDVRTVVGKLDFDHLYTLVAIADMGSFGGAAARVHRTQSAVSTQMKRLEETVGESLFEKQGRRAVLTPAGQSLLQYARRLVRLQEEALSVFHETSAEREIRIGVCDDYLLRDLPPVLSCFGACFPRVPVHLVSHGSQHLIEQVKSDALDFAIVNVSDRDLRYEPLRYEVLHWVTSSAHDTHEERPLPLVLERNCAWGGWARNALDLAGIDYRIAYSALTTGGIAAIVDAGLAVGTMGRGTMTQSMRVLGEADGFPALPHTTIGLVRRSSRIPAAADSLIAVIRERFAGDAEAPCDDSLVCHTLPKVCCGM